MANLVATTEDMTTVANAIRTKGGTSAPLSFPDEFASAIQAIPVPKPEQEKELTITENGDYPLTPDVGKVLSKVLAKVNVSGGGGGGDVSPFSAIKIETLIPATDISKHKLQNTMKDLAAVFMFSKNDRSNTIAGAINLVNPFPEGFSTFKWGAGVGKGTGGDGWGATQFLINYGIGEIDLGNGKFSAGKEYVFLLCYGPLK